MGYAMRKKIEELSDKLKAELQAIKGKINIQMQYVYELIGLLNGGLPAALGGAGGLKVEEQNPTPTAIAGGQNADVDTSAEVLASTQTCKGVLVQAHSENTGIVYVGGSTAQHVELEAGDSVPIIIDDIVKIYVKASVANQKVNYWYVS